MDADEKDLQKSLGIENIDEEDELQDVIGREGKIVEADFLITQIIMLQSILRRDYSIDEREIRKRSSVLCRRSNFEYLSDIVREIESLRIRHDKKNTAG
jgi:hypothetical protein